MLGCNARWLSSPGNLQAGLAMLIACSVATLVGLMLTSSVAAGPEGAGVLLTGGNPCNPKEPWGGSCRQYRYPDANATADIASTCKMMPAMCSCEVSKLCAAGKPGASSQYCQPFSLLATVCAADHMSSMSGCDGYNALCSPGNSTVLQCTADRPVPGFVSTEDAVKAIVGMCGSMGGMPGCKDCTSSKNCAKPIEALSQVCKSMPGMAGCIPFMRMCAAARPVLGELCPAGAATDNAYCDGQTVMYMGGFTAGFEGGTCIKILFWTLDSRPKYICGLIFAATLGIATELLLAFRRATLDGGGGPLGTVMHVVQLVLGYFLMLMAMSYHIPVFLAVISGVGIGHYVALRWQRMAAKR